MTIESRNARAMAAGHAAWDNASPAEDDGREQYIKEQADLLLGGDDAEFVPFGWDIEPGFAVAATESLCDADSDDCELLQLVLAVRKGEYELAVKLSRHFEDALVKTAEDMVRDAMEKANEK